ncbi:ABC transporter ATP-binding protein [Marinivivus vitaminiproducens]|uniref:ABC transporter ATP-binding protein n=1 Tax=Marinivivus vitaminiproducens TaxID=3035935 RepID=UPI003F9F3734
MHGKDVVLSRVGVRFGRFTAVHPTDLTVEPGEFFSILGPSGCGKTTLLRLISGFIEPSSGTVSIGGRDMAGVGPNRRPTALIFQNLALFPLMPIWENVAFGLEMRGWPKAKRRERAEELLDLVALGGQGHKKPAELSGGQRQRVAVARALAVEPAVLLLDEPLSALDLKLRQKMRAELKAIQRRTGVTFIYITHDQGEALTMSDRIAVMHEGRIEQVDNADRVYREPATSFVATFVGETNLFRGRVSRVENGHAFLDTQAGQLIGRNRDGLCPGDTGMLFVRPEQVRILAEPSEANAFGASFMRQDLEGAFLNAFFDANGQEIMVHLTNDAAPRHDLSGERSLGFAPDAALVLRPGEVDHEEA